MKTRFIMLIMITMLVVSCRTGSDKDTNGTHIVALSPTEDIIKSTDVMEITGWKALNSDSVPYIGIPSKLECMDGDFYILTKKPQQCVYRFSPDGNLLSIIGQTGNGEGEYTHAHDFTIDPDQHKILILSDNSLVFVYDINGQYIETKKLSDNLICSIQSADSGIYGTSGYADITASGSNHLIYRFDRDLKEIGKWIEYDEVKLPPFSITFRNPFLSNGRELYFLDNLALDLYDLSRRQDIGKPLISFKLSNPMPENIFGDTMKFMEMQGKYNWIMNAMATESSFIFAYIYDGHYSITQTDRNGNMIRSGKFDGMLPLECHAAKGDTVYSVITSDLYHGLWQKQEGINQPDFNVPDNSILLMEWQPKKQ